MTAAGGCRWMSEDFDGDKLLGVAILRSAIRCRDWQWFNSQIYVFWAQVAGIRPDSFRERLLKKVLNDEEIIIEE